jgi:ATP-dependent RNA/DNA helicase IGHMBP2
VVPRISIYPLKETNHLNLPSLLNLEEYFSFIRNQVTLEENFEKEEYWEELNKSSKKMKRNAGILWSSVFLDDVIFSDSNQITLFIKRKPDLIKPTIQPGQNVKLYRDAENATQEILGIVKNISHNEATIVIKGDDLPSWMEDGSFILEKTYSDITYKAMFYAIDTFEKNESKVIINYKKKIFDTPDPVKQNIDHRETYNFLNPSQSNAVNNILKSNDFYIVHGPPGTGKTTVIIESVNKLVSLGEKILLSASSNLAVDLLTEKTAEKNINVLRLGNPVRISENILHTTLDYKIKNHEYYKEIKKYKKQAEELIKKARSFKRNFGKQEYQDRKDNFKEAKELYKLCKKTEDIIIEDILDKTNVITATLTSLYISKIIKKCNFDSIFVDEASQALEPLCYLPIILQPSQRIIFVGDPNQLPPTIYSKKNNNGLKITFLEKLLFKFKDDPLKAGFLNIQYRMNDQILGFPNQEFYNNLLISDVSNKNHSIGKDKIDPNIHILFIDTVGADFIETKAENEQSIYNEQEGKLIFKIFSDYYSKGNSLTFGILSPYKAQVNFLEELFSKNESLLSSIEINTIDSFQGREKDCIFISLTRSNDFSEIGFLSDLKRMNVAMTRAKKELIIIGDSETLSSNIFFSKLIEHINNLGGYHSVWEYLEQ